MGLFDNLTSRCGCGGGRRRWSAKEESEGHAIRRSQHMHVANFLAYSGTPSSSYCSILIYKYVTINLTTFFWTQKTIRLMWLTGNDRSSAWLVFERSRRSSACQIANVGRHIAFICSLARKIIAGIERWSKITAVLNEILRFAVIKQYALISRAGITSFGLRILQYDGLHRIKSAFDSG